MKIVLTDDNTDVLLKSYCQKHSQEHLHTSENEAKEVDFISRDVNDSSEKLSNTNPQYEFWKYVEISKIYQEVSFSIFDYKNTTYYLFADLQEISL